MSLPPASDALPPEDEFEPLLADDPNRLGLFPITQPSIWEFYKKAVGSFWTVELIDLSKDLDDWFRRLNSDERQVISHILGFFVASDGIDLENLTLRFMREVKLPEARAFYGFQLATEIIHSETYSILLDTFVKNPQEKELLLRAIQKVQTMTRKADWALEWINSGSFHQRIVAFACAAGIFFSSSFSALFWIKKRGLLPGLCFSTELIFRDENLHLDFACYLYNLLRNKLSQDKIHPIISEAVEIEQDFVRHLLPNPLIGLNSTLLSEYIEFTADNLLRRLGYENMYSTSNPFDWMETETACLQKKTNFLETRPIECSGYSLPSFSREKDEKEF